MSRINLQNWQLSHLLEDQYLALLRMVFALSFLLMGGMYHFEWITRYPSFFYNPNPSIASFFPDFPPAGFLHAINVLLPILAVCILIGLKTKLSSILFGIIYTTGFSFAFSFGKIEHNFLVSAFALVFAFSGWGNKFSVDSYLSKPQIATDNGRVVSFYAIILAFFYFTSGISKLAGGWLDLTSQASFANFFTNYITTGRQGWLAGYALNLNSRWIWEIADYLTVMVEILPLLSVFSKKIFRFSWILVTVFHLVIFLVMNISFGYYPLLFLVFVVDWKHSRLIARTIRFLELHNAAIFHPSHWKWYFLVLVLYISIFYLRGNHHWIEKYPMEMSISVYVSSIFILYFYLEDVFQTQSSLNDNRRR